MSGILYLCGTPIGNLSDFSSRGVEVLQKVSLIAAEDTRHSLKLLQHFGISKPMISYFEHNRKERGEQILRRLLEGEDVALITDAGMPAISDPGEDLVLLCHQNGVQVSPVPGPCAGAAHHGVLRGASQAVRNVTRYAGCLWRQADCAGSGNDQAP